LALKYLALAHKDLMAAEIFFQHRSELARIITWHVQQAAEKAMKPSLECEVYKKPIPENLRCLFISEYLPKRHGSSGGLSPCTSH
jgi:hypothetical protein